MRRTLLLSASALFLCAPVPAAAQAPSPFELVRGLRDEGMPDLALEYLAKLAASNPPADLATEIPLEYARTRLELASLEVEDAKRNAQLALARKEFDAFLATNPNHPQRPQANLEIARLIALQGKAQLSKSRKTEGKAEKLAEIKKARPFFQDAAKRFAAAAKELSAQVESITGESSAETKLKEAAANGVLRAQLEQGIALYDLGQTFVADDEVRDRGKWIDDAKAILDKVGSKDEKSPLTWVARAWVAQADYENDRKGDAERDFKALLAEKGLAARDGIRVARYFRLRHLFDSQTANKYVQIQKDAQAWLENYSRYRDSAEGIATRYLLALATQSLAEGNLKRDPKTGKLTTPVTGPVRTQLEAAGRIYKSLADSDNEYTQRAARNRLSIILDLSAGRVDDPLKLTTFEEAFLAAMVEQAELAALANKAGAEPKAIEDEKAKVYTKVVELLRRALTLVKPSDPARDVFDAQMLLAYSYLTLDRHYEAAVLSEHLARTNEKSSKAASVAMMGLSAYNEAMAKLKANNGDEASVKSDIARIVALAKYMDKTWPAEGVTDTARHQLGFYLMREEKFGEAFTALSRVSSAYPELHRARVDEGAAAFSFQKNADAPDADRKAALAQAKSDLEALTAPPIEADADDATWYCRSQLQLGQLYLLTAADYAKAEAVGKKVSGELAKFKSLEAEKSKAIAVDLSYQARALAASALLGQANVANKEKDYAKVTELVSPALEEVKKDVEAPPAADSLEAKAPSRDFLIKMQRNILVLALRTAVQEKNIEKAKSIVELLQKAGGSGEATIETLKQVVREVRGTIDALKKEKPDEAKTLAASFTELLDEIAKPETLDTLTADPKNAKPDAADEGATDEEKAARAAQRKQHRLERMFVFLSQGYASIDEHTKAIALMERIQAPPGFNENPDAKTDAFAVYRNVQLMLAQTLRKAGAAQPDFKSGAPYFKRADDLLKSMLNGPPNIVKDGKKDPKKGWAYSSIEVRKETFYLLEDQKQWAKAIGEWSNYAKAWQKQVAPLPENIPGNPARQKQLRLNNIFFDLFVETQRCLTAANNTLKDETKKAAQFEKIAKSLIDLEARYPEMEANVKDEIRKLLDAYPLLTEKYNSAGGKLLKEAAAANP